MSAADPAAIPAAAAELAELRPGKAAADEDFPVASRLLSAEVRPAILCLYRFARAADDIADSPLLRPETKLAALAAADAALAGAPAPGGGPFGDSEAVVAASALRAVMLEKGIPVEHGRHLLQAFRKDVLVSRYACWSDLLAYCNYSAAPVGRFLLSLHREDRAAWPYADALCNAHQVLNHVQGCRSDYLRLDRVYIPLQWLAAESVEIESLADDRTGPALRRTLDRVLTGAEQLLDAARPLPRMLQDRGLRIQAATTLVMGDALLRRLRQRDPLHSHVGLGTVRKALCAASGLALGWRRAAA